MLADGGHITEIKDPRERIATIAKDYAAAPEKPLIVSPDNRSRGATNEAMRGELLTKGVLAEDGQQFKALAHRNDMTGADRTWAARYEVGDVLQYTKGSKAEGLERDSFATVRSVDARANTITVEKADGESVTYDPRRVRGVNAYKETAREFATGDRIQFIAQDKELRVANRDLGTITGIQPGQMTVRLDGKVERTITFDPDKVRGLDHGYAVTSHSSQGLTEREVFVNMDTEASRNLINERFAYVSLSRAELGIRIYTNDAEGLGQKLAADVSKTAAVDFKQQSTTEQTREAVQAFRSNDPGKATETFQQQGRVYEYAASEQRIAAVVSDYTSRPDRTVIVAPDPIERQELIQLIRADLQQQGKIAADSRTVPVLVEQELGNPKLAANYSVGDEIHYRKGSPADQGIADNSTAEVIAVNPSRNTLTVETLEGQVSYKSALLKAQTGQSTVYREEKRDLAVGDRIQFTATDRESRIRTGDFATVERIGDDNALSLRSDNGRAIELDFDKARHIEHGYAVEEAGHLSADRILLTGDSSQLAEQGDALTCLNPHTKDIAIYTSEGTTLQQQQSFANEVGIDNPGFSNDPGLSNMPEPSLPEIDFEGYGLGI